MEKLLTVLQYAGPGGFAVLAVLVLYIWQQRPLMRKLLEVMDRVATRDDLDDAVYRVDSDRAECRGHLGQAAETMARVTATLEHANTDVRWLREAHDRRDEDGVPVWYVPRRLFTEIERQGEAAVKRDEAMLETLRGLNRTLARVEDRLAVPTRSHGPTPPGGEA